jgi:hypothetical protein
MSRRLSVSVRAIQNEINRNTSDGRMVLDKMSFSTVRRFFFFSSSACILVFRTLE